MQIKEFIEAQAGPTLSWYSFNYIYAMLLDKWSKLAT